MGLKTIKGLSKDFAIWIIENRPFITFEDFILRLPHQYRKKEQLLPLIQLGLFDEIESNRKKIVENLENLFVFAEAFVGHFLRRKPIVGSMDDYSNIEKYNMEQEIIGLGISPHPLIQLRKQSSQRLTDIVDLETESKATVLVQIQSVRVIRTKKLGSRWSFYR